MEDIDVEYLRGQLRDYYGTAMTSSFPMAVMELSEVDSMSDDELIEKEEELGLML